MQKSKHKARPVNVAPQRPGDEAFQRGLRLMRGGDHSGAEQSYRHCLTADPKHGEAHHHLGLLVARRGDAAAAIPFLERAIALLPNQAEAYGNLGLVLRHAGRLDQAIVSFRKAASLQPRSAERHQQLALVLAQAGALDEASAAFATATRADPKSTAAIFAHAEVLRIAGRADEATALCRTGLSTDPHDPGGLNTFGLLLDQTGDIQGAQACFRRAHAQKPEAVHLLVNLTHVAIKLKSIDEASGLAEQAVRLEPRNPVALGNLGTVRKLQRRVREALEAFGAAIDVDPRNPRHYTNLGALLVEIRQSDAAIAACGIATTLAPNDAEGHFNLAVARRQKGQLEQAIAAYRASWTLGSAEALVDICHLRQQICDWPGLDAEQASCLQSTYRRGKRVAPFSILTAAASADEQRHCARVFAAGFETGHAWESAAPRRPLPDGRLRIGYLSSDFHEHATASLLVGMIERHDRERFACFGYSYGPDDGTPMRRRMVQAFDAFTDVRELDHGAAADRIAADGIDILIDLKGYTQDARTEILALRPAPIQVNYLGYPGTMGASFIDYLVADAFIIPDHHRDLYDEKIATLAHCYQPNDALRAVAPVPDRRAVGLPENAFVFCSFNNTYKITPDVFSVWMRLLRAVPNAVLWLLDAADAVAGNLKREAAARGVDPDRLIFAPRIPSDQHIARMVVADLFLDTLPVNAHTTASEALWVGLPVLTCVGESFVSRVAGSLLHTMGAPELVTESLEAYESKALELASDAARLRSIRARLTASRATSPLFDIERYTRGFEDALLRMADLRRTGRPPESFTLVEPSATPRPGASAIEPTNPSPQR